MQLFTFNPFPSLHTFQKNIYFSPELRTLKKVFSLGWNLTSANVLTHASLFISFYAVACKCNVYHDFFFFTMKQGYYCFASRAKIVNYHARGRGKEPRSFTRSIRLEVKEGRKEKKKQKFLLSFLFLLLRLPRRRRRVREKREKHVQRESRGKGPEQRRKAQLASWRSQQEWPDASAMHNREFRFRALNLSLPVARA